jgi:hypothetical protein
LLLCLETVEPFEGQSPMSRSRDTTEDENAGRYFQGRFLILD